MEKPRPWLYCPSCDAYLGVQVFPGDDWHCQACGEEGTRATKPKSRWGVWDLDTTESM